MNQSQSLPQPQARDVPQFTTFAEALDYYIKHFPRTDATQVTLRQIRDVLVASKASLVFDAEKSKAWNAQQEAYLRGQLRIVELLLIGPDVSRDDEGNLQDA